MKERNLATSKAIQVFKKKGGILRTSQALKEGIHPTTLYDLRNQGKIETMGRGIYKLADISLQGDPDIIQVASRFPNAVICLVSALYIHELTTQIPRSVNLAIKEGTHQPRVSSPPTTFFVMSEKSFEIGIKEMDFHGVKVKIYDAEKTVVDCFKFRTRVGLDVAIDALKSWKEKRGKNITKLLEYARICRVEKIMTPYLEALS